MNTYYVETYFRKGTDVKRLDDIPALDDYTQDTKQLKITANSKDDMILKVLKKCKNVAYVHVLEVQQKQI